MGLDGVDQEQPPRAVARRRRDLAAGDPALWKRAASPATRERQDPFFDPLWPGPNAFWTNREAVARLASGGVTSPLTKLLVDAPEAERSLRNRLKSAQHGAPVIRVLAALHAWRTATLEQLAALTGDSAVMNTRSSLVADLFSAGLIELGTFGPWTKPERRHRQDFDLMRLGHKRNLAPFARSLREDLRLRLTDGDGWVNTPPYERHDVLALELGLRASEFIPSVSGVLGERFSRLNRLAAGPFSPADEWRSSADVTLLRRDGTAIAVELTANTSQTFSGKVSRWVQLLADPYYGRELCVVFLLAPRQDKPGEITALRTRVERQIKSRIVRTLRTAAAPRIVVASWSDWFPDRHVIGAQFQHLRGRVFEPGRGDEWTSIRLIEAPPTTPGSDFPSRRAASLLRHAAALDQTPRWLQNGERTQRDRVLIEHRMAAEELLPCCSDEGAIHGERSPEKCRIGRFSHCPKS